MDGENQQNNTPYDMLLGLYESLKNEVATIKEENEKLKKSNQDIISFNKALLNKKATPTTKEDEHESAVKAFNDYLKERKL